MRTFLRWIAFFVIAPGAAKAQQRILLAEQAGQRIALADVATGNIIWEWKPSLSNVDSAHWKWFSNPSDVKPVYEGKYILVTASGGGVALIRMADNKTLFYAYAGGNPHSAEILPDGNIVVASSSGNYLTMFQTDTLATRPGTYSSRIYIDFGHNVVWDRKRQLLWSADRHQLKSFHYNFDCMHPGLAPVDSMPLPGQQSHDLFPTFDGDALWLTNTTHVYRLNVSTRQLLPAATPQKDIKSISSGPAGYPTILSIPQEQWWTDEVRDTKDNSIFRQEGLKIYKARWLVTNNFSYPPGDDVKICPSPR
ncbi:DUF6528 family protein [Flavitalea sp. BT771]|uniref:DUF6528 family protein n=1 Tax=Flavitalea sp. BT771 TaxID=3063329 RepID=UPI0026E3236C|nr:DUF6528 family protein [Flavitalea sp. BT771]MDO6429285.1 DUF6528 family protein [Flavitalea sp. BT771]MDV6218587.1 DUF6528 family protein [Flavitalea sp. BT771]